MSDCPRRGWISKSSRNTYLNEEERKAALILSKSVALGKKMVADGETSAAVVKEAMIKKIESEPMAKIDYVEAVDGLSMQPVEEIKAPKTGSYGCLYRKNKTHR